MIIELVFPNSASSPGTEPIARFYSVQNYNDATVITTTPSLFESARLAAREATAFDRAAIIRIHAGRLGRSNITLTTGPRALVAVALVVALARFLADVIQSVAEATGEARRA